MQRIFVSIFGFFDKQKKRRLLKPCAKCGRMPKIVNRGDGWYDIYCFSTNYHYGIGFSRGQYKKNFVAQAKRWNELTDEIAKRIDL